MSGQSEQPSRPVVRLRPVEPGDLPVLCALQQDPESCALAAVNPRTTDNFHEHWRNVLEDENIVARSILADDGLVGSISKFRVEAEDMVGYWIAREHWGRGIATRALQLLLDEVTVRPLHARVVSHNAASLRVLERCGFAITGSQHEPGTDRYLPGEVVFLTLH